MKLRGFQRGLINPSKWLIQSLSAKRMYFKSPEKARNYIKSKNINGYFLLRYSKERKNYLKAWIFINGKFKRVKNEN